MLRVTTVCTCLAAACTVVGVVPAARAVPGSASARAKPAVELRVLPDGRAAVLRRDRLRVLVGVRRHPVRLRLVARGRARAALTRPRLVRVGAGRRRVIRLALNARGRRLLSSCAAGALTLHARRVVQRRRAGRVLLRRHRTRLKRSRRFAQRGCGGGPGADGRAPPSPSAPPRPPPARAMAYGSASADTGRVPTAAGAR